jgi:small conductance mechanosensitive channel
MEQLWLEHSETILPIVIKFIQAGVMLIIAHYVIKILHNSVEKAQGKLEAFDETLIPIVKRIVTIGVYLLAVVVILDLFGVNTGSIIALLGAAGLAVGLALKDTLSNIAAGVMLLVLRPFSVGNRIDCGSFGGFVREIGLFTTIIETVDGLYVSAPNSAIWGSPIINYSRNKMRRVDIEVGISYTDSIDKAFEVLNNIKNSETRLLNKPEPEIFLNTLGDNSVNIMMRVWVPNDLHGLVKWDMSKKVKESIEAAGLSIPFPQREVHIIEHKKLS